MKTTLFALALLAGLAITAQAQTKPATSASPVKQEEEYTAVEQMPSFPGGISAMQQFLQQKMIYPDSAKKFEIQGTVYVEILVKASGKIAEPMVVKALGYGLDKESLRLITLMPPWDPGKHNGKPVDVRMTIPIKFRLY